MICAVYLAGPISGLTYNEATAWRNDPEFRRQLGKAGWTALSPLDLHGPPPDPHAILDAWFEEQIGENIHDVIHSDLRMIRNSDAVLVNFQGARKVSIGTCAEIGYARALDLPIITLIEQGDHLHWHPFIEVLSHSIVKNLGEAVEILSMIHSARRAVPYA